ncbi:MAG: hypothetical protein RL322_1488, partial [Pseudomonadota bacterium]
MVTKVMNKTHTPNADSAPALADQGTAGSAQPVRTLVKGFRRGRVPLETVQLPLPGFEQALTDPPRDTSPAGGRAAVRDDAPSSDQGPVAADRSEQALDLTLSHPSFSSDTSVFPASAEGAVGSLWVQAGTSAGATATDASAGANASGSAASYLSGLSASNAILLGLGFIAAGALVFRTEEKAPINLAPVLAKPLVDLAAVEGEAFSVVLDRSSFVDPEGAAVTWSLAAVKNSNGDAVSLNWLVFDPVALTLTGTPDALSRGDYELTIKVVDGQGLEAVDHFIFSVAPNSTVFDGYLKYALVFRDEIADGIWDHEPINAIAFETDSLGKVKVASISYTDLNNDGQFTAEPWALTNNAGLAPPVGGSGVLRTAAWQEGGTIDGVAIGGTVDISTGRPFESVLSAPAGSGVISPVTTLITAQLGAGAATANPAAIAAASQQVAGLLFGSGTAVDLLNLDPVKNLASGATGDAAKLALQVQAAGQQVANILQVAVAAAQAGGVVDLASVTGAVTSSLLGSATGGSLDLGDTAKLNAAIASVASLVTNADAKALIEQQSAAIAQTIATVNQKISTVITTAVTQINSGATFSVADVLTDTTAFQLVAQQTLAQQVSSAVSNAVSDPGSTGPVDFNINVDQAVEEVRDQVQQVIVPTTPNSAPTLVSGGVVTGAATEGMSPVQLSGSFGFSDPDTADLPVVGVTSRTFTGVAADGSTVLDLTAAQKLALGLGFSVDAASSNTNVGTVDWSYLLPAAAVDFLAAGDQVTGTFVVTVNDRKGGSVAQTITVTLTGTNDAPVATFNAAQAVNEDASSLTGQLTATDQDNGAALSYSLVGDAIAGFTLNANGSWSFDPKNAAYQSLAQGQTQAITVNYKVTDDKQAQASGAFVVTVTGTNDAPLISVAQGNSASATLTEVNQGLTGSGTLTVADADLTNTVVATVHSVAASGLTAGLGLDNAALLAMMTVNSPNTVIGNDAASGVIGWSFSSGSEAFNYLPAGQSITLTYTIRATDSNSPSTSDDQSVTITITGSNDTPLIVVGTGNSAAETLTETNAGLSVSGSLGVTDPEVSDTVTVAVQSVTTAGVVAGLSADNAALLAMLTLNNQSAVINNTSTTGTINWTFASGSEGFNYLAAGQQLVLTYTVRATDSSNAGSYDDQTVVITVTGTNDVPVATFSAAQAVAEDATALTGQLTATDADAGAVLSYALVGQAIAGLTINSNGSWTFDPTNAAYQSLAQGQTQEITVNYEVSDQNQGKGTGSFKVTVTGTNDVPVITATDVSGSITEPSLSTASATLTDSGSLTFADVDGLDRPSATEATKSITASRVVNNVSSTITLTSEQVQLIENAFSITPQSSNTNNGTVDWSYSISESVLHFLGQGDTVTAVFTVTVGNQALGQATQDVTITIAGSNDAPVATGETLSAIEDTPITFIARTSNS